MALLLVRGRSPGYGAGMRYPIAIFLCSGLLLGGCDTVRSVADRVTQPFVKPTTSQPAEEAAAVAPAAPEAVVDQPLPPSGPSAPVTLPLAAPAKTVAGLGDPARPGLWLETPLVQQEQPARIVGPGGGEVRVTLLPIPGASTAGSRMSLDAMRQIGVPLTELVEVTVYPVF